MVDVISHQIRCFTCDIVTSKDPCDHSCVNVLSSLFKSVTLYKMYYIAGFISGGSGCYIPQEFKYAFRIPTSPLEILAL